MSQSHSQESKSEGDNESVEESLLDAFKIESSGKFIVGSILGPQSFILGKAKLSINGLKARLT